MYIHMLIYTVKVKQLGKNKESDRKKWEKSQTAEAELPGSRQASDSQPCKRPQGVAETQTLGSLDMTFTR